MTSSHDTWTKRHDLALVYIALAYGTDNRLSDAELDTITEYVHGWNPDAKREDVQELVLEAVSVYLETPTGEEVTRAIGRLRKDLSAEERRRVLEEVVDVARADGMILASERGLITTIATAWEMKTVGDDLLAQPAETADERPQWSLLHDVALLYILFAHGTDGDLSQPEIDASLDRLHDWQPDLEADDIRRVLREALAYYGSGLDAEALQQPVLNLANALPMMQRLAVLDDLRFIAEVDGALVDGEHDMLRSIAEGLQVGINLNGEA